MFYHSRPEWTWEQWHWKDTPHSPQSSSITGSSPLNCLMSYPGHSLRESYLFEETQSVYSAIPANWANAFLACGVYLFALDAVGVFEATRPPDRTKNNFKKGKQRQFFGNITKYHGHNLWITIPNLMNCSWLWEHRNDIYTRVNFWRLLLQINSHNLI